MTIMCTIVYIFVIKFVATPRGWKADLMKSAVNLTENTDSKITPTPTARQFQFNEDSDLELELEPVNPKTEDSDFEPINKMIQDL